MREIVTILLILFLVGCEHMTPEQKYAFLADINTQVNTDYKYQPEENDVWLTMEEFMARGYGDCEDFAITKCTLVRTKFKPADILIGQDRKTANLYHAVTLVENYWVLDNNKPTPYPLSQFNQKYKSVIQLPHCADEAIEKVKGTHSTWPISTQN